eukprot:TRINITY_DN31439_c0_g1_i1.p1 TRINITY_DN31439_c0_g1~~TRINITY_DN31439_c0_g1_i1.p1  ORF type:complete len:167 (+),score=16.71 TRINITY_DN31439_c0_g1_i1:3-503(+)
MLLVIFFFSSRRRHTRFLPVSWARRCVQETVSTQSTWDWTYEMVVPTFVREIDFAFRDELDNWDTNNNKDYKIRAIEGNSGIYFVKQKAKHFCRIVKSDFLYSRHKKDKQVQYTKVRYQQRGGMTNEKILLCLYIYKPQCICQRSQYRRSNRKRPKKQQRDNTWKL